MPTRLCRAIVVAVAASASAVLPARAGGADAFGVIVSGDSAARHEVASITTDLGARWVRLNVFLDGADQDYTVFLAAGVNVVLTCTHRDPSNVDTTYGTLAAWPNAGFPYRSKATYQQRVHDLLQPALPFLAQGRTVWVQCENEVGDATSNPNARYWRGTLDEYLTQLDALFTEVRAIDPRIVVVLTSFPSESLDAALDPADPKHDYAVSKMARLLSLGQYDAADLHFYGCVQDIPAKIAWLRGAMPAGKLWISTENGGPDTRCASTPTPYSSDPAAFEQLEAQQVPARLSACVAGGGRVCLWFSLFDLRHETEVFAHLGLLDASVLPPRKKPAYDAFKTYVASVAIRPPRRHLHASPIPP